MEPLLVGEVSTASEPLTAALVAGPAAGSDTARCQSNDPLILYGAAMPVFTWPIELDSALRGLGGGEASSHARWAIQTVESLHYLADLDEWAERSRWIAAGHHTDIIDLAHARWSASTAMTALDLCAAAIGFRHDLPTRGDRVHDLEQLNRKSNRGELCEGCIEWIDAVRADSMYQVLKGLRDPFVHRRLPRFVPLSTLPPQEGDDRLGFSWSNTPGEDKIRTDEVVRLTIEMATRHVIGFLKAVASRSL